ncbi:hypothetical protein [Leptolyngbya sp. FACHB-16]|uniref:hypothetical protein n=1 Tax=unclassified Leptolyngbya TaxID=2650499 RepID=UPI00168232E1|nr:hypothetical protein [Leptolyngbya sp. FACHB-16]MBD2156167.1 hypothetical protein [Leptolyngbya sp. FACHB-16]
MPSNQCSSFGAASRRTHTVDASLFHKRELELSLLKNWVSQVRCRLVMLFVGHG